LAQWEAYQKLCSLKWNQLISNFSKFCQSQMMIKPQMRFLQPNSNLKFRFLKLVLLSKISSHPAVKCVNVYLSLLSIANYYHHHYSWILQKLSWNFHSPFWTMSDLDLNSLKSSLWNSSSGQGVYGGQGVGHILPFRINFTETLARV